MTKKSNAPIVEQLNAETKEIEFTAEMSERVMKRLEKPLPWWQREIRIHVPAALAVACIGVGAAFWLLGSPLPEPSQSAGPLVVLDSGIFLESELSEWISGR